GRLLGGPHRPHLGRPPSRAAVSAGESPPCFPCRYLAAFQLWVADQTVSVLLGHLYRGPAPRVLQERPDAPAAGTGVKPQFSLAHAVPQEGEHRMGLVAAQPLRLGHQSSLVPEPQVWSQIVSPRPSTRAGSSAVNRLTAARTARNERGPSRPASERRRFVRGTRCSCETLHVP